MLRELCRVEDHQRIMKEEGVEQLMLAGMERFGDATDGVGMGERAYKGCVIARAVAGALLIGHSVGLACARRCLTPSHRTMVRSAVVFHSRSMRAMCCATAFQTSTS